MVLNWLTILFYRFRIPGFYIKKEKNRKIIYLTLDDGPNELTPVLLQWMTENGIYATHFWIGEKIAVNPSAVSNPNGQSFSFHGFTHRNYSKISSSEIETELNQLFSFSFENQPGYQTWFRPPYGSWRPGLNKLLKKYKLKLIFWTYIFTDWKETFSPDEIEIHKKDWLRDGSVLVFHDKAEYHERLKDSLLKVKMICNHHHFELLCLPSLK